MTTITMGRKPKRKPTRDRKRRPPHPAFPQLPPETEVWRFLDLAKLIDYLSNRHLYLTRLDRMPDKHEGSIPRLSKALERNVVQRVPPKHRRFGFDMERELIWRSSARRHLVAGIYVSCWRHGEEIDAMWRLYCGPREGVALRTTYGRLRSSISGPKTYIGAIQYVDYDRDYISTNNLLTHLMHKRDEFAPEQEVRILRVSPLYRNPSLGRSMPWDMHRVIEEVVISPYADRWYFDCVRAAVNKFSPRLGRRIRWSCLHGDPLY